MTSTCGYQPRYVLAMALVLAASGQAQTPDVLKQGEQIFATTCATGYCHGARGGPGGAPRLAGRGFDQDYIRGVVARGIPDTGMASFATKLPPPALMAVVAYVATLNGITNPNVETARPVISGEAARGAELFRDAVRGFGRCSTCHEMDGFGVPVASPIANVPASAAALKALATPNVKTAAMGNESMPALVLSESKRSTLFYDLTSPPPVQRNAEPGSVKFTEGGNWRHSSAIGAYKDSELDAILTFLRAVVKP
jgi:mono/diheme cytochrome c family protein